MLFLRQLFNFLANYLNILRNSHEIMTKKYGLLGHPLGHSFSRRFHNERFSRLGIDAEYVNFDLDDIQKLPNVLANEPTLCGLNVTIPYKQQVMQFLDELDPVAERIGAVNTVCFKRISLEECMEKKSKLQGLWLKGFNTTAAAVGAIGAGVFATAVLLYALRRITRFDLTDINRF